MTATFTDGRICALCGDKAVASLIFVAPDGTEVNRTPPKCYLHYHAALDLWYAFEEYAHTGLRVLV